MWRVGRPAGAEREGPSGGPRPPGGEWVGRGQGRWSRLRGARCQVVRPGTRRPVGSPVCPPRVLGADPLCHSEALPLFSADGTARSASRVLAGRAASAFRSSSPGGARGRWSRPSGRPSSALGGLGVGQRWDSQLVVPAGRGALSWASPQNCVRGALLFHFIGQESEAPESACPDHPTSVLGGASSAAHRGGGFGAAAQRVTRRQTRRPARLVGSGRAPIRDAVAAPDPRDLRATGCRRP